jgi:hypothetical protein
MLMHPYRTTGKISVGIRTKPSGAALAAEVIRRVAVMDGGGRLVGVDFHPADWVGRYSHDNPQMTFIKNEWS